MLSSQIRSSWSVPGPRSCSFDLSSLEPVTKTVGIIGLVSKQASGLIHGGQERNGHGDVGDIARRQGEGDRSATIIGQSMDYARSSAARTPNRFRELPLLSQRPSGAL
jgi:hypothetical protein